MFSKMCLSILAIVLSPVILVAVIVYSIVHYIVNFKRDMTYSSLSIVDTGRAIKLPINNDKDYATTAYPIKIDHSAIEQRAKNVLPNSYIGGCFVEKTSNGSYVAISRGLYNLIEKKGEDAEAPFYAYFRGLISIGCLSNPVISPRAKRAADAYACRLIGLKEYTKCLRLQLFNVIVTFSRVSIYDLVLRIRYINKYCNGPTDTVSLDDLQEGL